MCGLPYSWKHLRVKTLVNWHFMLKPLLVNVKIITHKHSGKTLSWIVIANSMKFAKVFTCESFKQKAISNQMNGQSLPTHMSQTP